jgi:argininosuccinate lyase
VNVPAVSEFPEIDKAQAGNTPFEAGTLKQWGGRFSAPTDPLVERFSGSVAVDGRLILHDIAGSIAHARMLGRQEILSAAETALIVDGLQQVRADYEAGMLVLDERLEDVHTVVEAALRARIGEVAGKLHTARSRNDQVAVDLRLFTRHACTQAIEAISELQAAFLEQARACFGLIMPGYTHLQRAQPILVSHHLLAYLEMLQRDVQRFTSCYTRADVLPLGSGALAGVPYPVDRAWLAAELGMSGVAQNSIDAVADRDFAIEFCAAASTTMMHLSRFAEETILWCSAEFGFWELEDSFATGSSIMPQKKNPDVAELIRGKTGRVYGDLQALLTLMKGLPLAYNRDMQEDKPPLFDAVDTVLACLEAAAGLVRALRPNAGAMAAAAGNLLCATDVADYLVGKGLPFREAHAVTGSLVRLCLATGTALQDLDLASYRRASPLIDVTIYDRISPQASVAARAALGGTAPRAVQAQLDRAATLIAQNRTMAEDLAR